MIQPPVCSRPHARAASRPPDLLLTHHAAERYQDRVADIPRAEILAAIDTPAVRAAVAFGAQYVRLGTGQRLVLDGNRIVTVLPADTKAHHCRCIGQW